MSESLDTLRRSNPRMRPGFDQTLSVASEQVRARLSSTAEAPPTRFGGPHRLVRASWAGAVLAATAAAVVFFAVGSLGGRPDGADARAAVERAATVTAASADRSGTAVVRITHGGRLWAGTTIHWNGDDLSVSGDYPRRSGAGGELRVVDGRMYGPAADGGWLALGSPASIDPDSGTTPAEYLAAVRQDAGGATLGRLSSAMTGLATRELTDGSIAYSGTAAAGAIARETGFKEGRAIRVFPFGYVAHGAAADPASPLAVRMTVAADGVIRELAVSWGAGDSRWVYSVAYSGLGATPAPLAPPDAQPLRSRSN